MNNGEIVPRLWLIYLQETDKAFCFCCKLFSNSKSTFCTGSNTWEGIAKKLKEHENGTAHKNALVIGCCSEKGFDLTQRWTNKKWKPFFRKERLEKCFVAINP